MNDKHTSEALDVSNQKPLQKIVGKFLYCDRSIESTVLIGLNSLAVVQTKPTVEKEKDITHFLNDFASHPNSVREYNMSYIILHIYSDISYLSKPDSHSRSGGFSRPAAKNQYTNINDTSSK